MNKNYFIGTVILALLVVLGFWYFSPRKNVVNENNNSSSTTIVKPDLNKLPQVYKSEIYKFGINLPSDFTVDENHRYESTPMRTFPGVKFKIPLSLYDGTNLSSDSYVSVETSNDSIDSCISQVFLDSSELRGMVDINNQKYTIAYSLGAGVGNRYDETVYSTFAGGKCIGVRYYIHYSIIENYPKGKVKEFNEIELKKLFDSIRESIVFK